MQGVGHAGWHHGVIHEHFILLPQGPSTVLGYSQGGRGRSCVPGVSTRESVVESLLYFFRLLCHCGHLLDELFPLWCVIPWGGMLEKGKKKQSAASCILFVSCGPGLDDVCVCVFGVLALWTFHVCVFLVMLCSAKAGWHHQALERALGGTGSVEGLWDFVPVRASNLGLSWSVCSRCGWKKEEQQENSAIIFGPSFVRQVDNTASQSGSWSTKTHQVMIWAVQGPWLGDVHEVQWPWHYMTPETQTHHYQLVRLTVIFGPYLAWPSLCINDARDSVPSGLFFLPLLQWHFLSGETVWDSGFWYRPRR